jgi:hypothetical protein
VRRLRLVEFFDYITKQFDITEKLTKKNQNRYIIETKFHKMVIIEKKVGTANKLELLSFYPI